MDDAIRYLETKLEAEIDYLFEMLKCGLISESDYEGRKEAATKYYNKLIDDIVTKYYN